MVAPKPQSRVALFDFIWTLVRTDFKVRYHGAFGGFVWALLKPIAMFFVLYRVFRFLFHDPLYMMNLLIGLLLWSFFGEATAVGLSSLLQKRHLLTKAEFPRWIAIATSLANALLTLIVYSVSLIVMVLIEGRPVGFFGVAAFLFFLVLYFFIVFGFSLGASVLYLEYRDLDQVWDVALQAGFFLAPIIYPLGVIPERYHFWLYAWPPTPIIQFSRQALLDGTLPTLRALIMTTVMAAGVFAIGAIIFRLGARRAMEKL